MTVSPLVNLGVNGSGTEELEPCSPPWWSAGSAGALQRRLGLADIPRPAG
jgi:hypothetical protein